MTEQYDIKTDIKIGQQIFENLPNDIRPGWAGLVLSRFDYYIKDVPTSISELYPIINDIDRWKEAHEQFTKIRVFGLENKNYNPENYLRLAELVAKVTYNASGQSAPFDSDSGHYIASLALKATEYFEDNRLEEEVKSAILLFNRNKKFKDNLTVAKDFLLYKKIDDILWFDWDPIGINDFAPRDEYQSYVSEIFGLVKANADRQEIANRLHKLETENMGMGGTIEKCLTIADKILNAQ
ncbi:hypothetical protein PG593_11035 [Riemerella anatipestifer]|nr:hypothetical protein [Riemerella anatipestifer]